MYLGQGALDPVQDGAGKKPLGSLGNLLSQARLGGGTGCGETSLSFVFLNPGDLKLGEEEVTKEGSLWAV